MTPTETLEVQATINILAAQRDQAMNEIAHLHGLLAVAQDQIKTLTEKVEGNEKRRKKPATLPTTP